MTDLHDEAEKTIGRRGAAPRKNYLRDVMSYNDSMTISQVVRFFERQGVVFTKSMIQHYVRVGLLPPPEDKRRYTRFHLLLLTVIEELKGLYALDELAAAFAGIEGSDGLIDPFRGMMDYADAAWRGTLGALADKAAETAEEMGLEGHEARRMADAFVLLGIMTQSAAAKQTAGLLIGG